MSAENTRSIVENYLDAFNQADHDAMLSLLHEDVAHDINQGSRDIGIEKFRWFLAMMARHYEETLADISVMTNQSGTRAAAEFTVRGRYISTADGLPPANNQPYSLPAVILFEVDDEKITRVTTYYNLEEWKRQIS